MVQYLHFRILKLPLISCVTFFCNGKIMDDFPTSHVFHDQRHPVWVNYNELTTSLLEIIVSKGNHPQMAELFRLVNYYNLPRNPLCFPMVFCFISQKAVLMCGWLQICAPLGPAPWKVVREPRMLVLVCAGDGGRFLIVERTQ